MDALSTTLTERVEKGNDEQPKQNDSAPRELLPEGNVQGLNLSDILNVLDGLYTSEGTICFFTTNHIEKLDSAFLRDGRMDCKIEMGDLTKDVANQMIKDKLGFDDLFQGNEINPATLQELIIQVIWGKLHIDEFKKRINQQ